MGAWKLAGNIAVEIRQRYRAGCGKDRVPEGRRVECAVLEGYQCSEDLPRRDEAKSEGLRAAFGVVREDAFALTRVGFALEVAHEDSLVRLPEAVGFVSPLQELIDIAELQIARSSLDFKDRRPA